MYCDEETEEYISTVTDLVSPNYLPPLCWILKTVEDRDTGTVWHKLMTNEKATRLILKSKAYSSWDLRQETTGKKFLWVTKQFLTLLHIQGLQKVDN
jgi:hypothetical protein